MRVQPERSLQNYSFIVSLFFLQRLALPCSGLPEVAARFQMSLLCICFHTIVRPLQVAAAVHTRLHHVFIVPHLLGGMQCLEVFRHGPLAD